MAEIEIDISLLSANPVDVDSPYANQGANVILSNPAESSVTGATQSLIADIFAVGPSGPAGPQGPSGEMGPSGAIGPSGPINTGELDQRYYSINNPSGFITGVDLSQYATITDVALTGSTLDNKIDLLSGVTVLKFSDQIITGVKDFVSRPTVNTIPVLLSGENANGLSVLVKNDDSATIQKGQPVYIFGANGNNILVRRATNTGEATSSKTLGLLNETLAPNDQGYVITEGGLEGINTSAGNAGDPIWLGPTGNLIFGLANKPYAPNHLVYLGVVERKQSNNGKIYVKVQNGFELQELHNVNIDHSYILNNDDVLRYNTVSGLWFNQSLNTGIFKIAIENTGSILNSRIDSLSGVAVLTYGDQTINGTKYFNENVYIHDLYVTGTEFITTTQNNFVQSPYLLLNLTGGAIDGGIFFVTGSGFTGINDLGPIIGFDHSDKFKFGISSRASDLSTLNDIAAVQDIITYSGFVDNKYATIINLNSTGSQLQTQINNLYSSGFITGVDLSNYVTKTNGQFNDRPTVDGTGVLLSGEAANVDLSSTVQITGDQNISGVKNFYSRPTVNGTGVLLSGEAAGGGGVLEKRHDFVTGSPYDYSYCGTAPENSLESGSVWDITRLSIDSAGLVALNQSVTNYSWTGRYLAPYA